MTPFWYALIGWSLAWAHGIFNDDWNIDGKVGSGLMIFFTWPLLLAGITIMLTGWGIYEAFRWMTIAPPRS